MGHLVFSKYTRPRLPNSLDSVRTAYKLPPISDHQNPAYLMFSKLKIEFIVSSLLLSTLALIAVNQFFLRSFEVNANNSSLLGCTDDREEGGKSEASATVVGNIFRLRYLLDTEAYVNAYVAISIAPDDDTQSDLSWVDSFEVTVRADSSEKEQILLHVRNFEPDISSNEDRTSLKYNEALLDVSNEFSTVTVNRNDFLVPTWWKQRYDVRGNAAKPSFTNVDCFEFNINRGAGQGEIDIVSIRCVGRWFEAATLYQRLLWMWMCMIFLIVIYRLLNLTKELNDKTASATQLLAHNNFLISESATYQELARRDPLTGLLNRYGLESELDVQSSKYYFNFTMILFDLDNFKEINDTLGHCYGDRVLFEIARIVKTKLNSNDLVARWGGDEFVILLHDRDVKEAVEFAEEVRRTVSMSDLNYSCSFGICTSEIENSFETTFRNADTALYDSKGNGRNKISVHQQSGDDQASDGLRKNGGRREMDQNISEVPTITLPSAELPMSGFSVYE